jgi:Tol biopolymer transport system component
LLANRSMPEVPASPFHRQVTFTGQASSPALSADRRWLSFASHKRLFVQDLRSPGADPVSVAHASRVLWTSRWSPDGLQLFYVAADSAGFGIHVVPRQGGPSRRLAAASRFDVAPAGDLLYATNGTDSIIVLEASSGARKGGFSLRPLATTVFSPAAAPNSHWVAFAGVQGGTTFLGVSRTDGSQARRLVEGVPRWGSLAWSRRGDAIYYLRDLGSGANVAAAGDVMKVGIDPQTGERRGDPVTVLGGAFVQEFFLSPDRGHLAYTKAPPQQRIWTMTLNGPAARPKVAARELTTGTNIHGTPDISSDGLWVVFARNDGGTGNLYITPFDHYEPRPLVASPADEWSPRFSPDGRYVAYAVRDSGTTGILVVDVAGAQVRRITSDGLAPLGVITWMPEGSEVVFPLDLGQHYAIQDIASGQRDTLVVPDSIGSFHLTVASPTGQYLVSNAGRGAAHELWAVERSGVPWKRLDEGTVRVRWPLLWTRTGWFYFLSGEALQGDTLWRVRVDGGPATLVAELPQPCSGWQTALSADAHRLVCVVSKAEPDIWIAENFDPETQ